MANHKNDHNREMTTTVAVRTEVERALGSAVPQGKQRKDIVERVEQIVERYSSPYPDPQYLEQIERLSPGSTKDILDCAISDLKHRQKMDEETLVAKREEIQLVKDIATGELRSTIEGRRIGFAAYVLCFVFSGTMFYLGSETLAAAAFGAAVLGIIGQLIRGGDSRSVVIKPHEKSKTPGEKPKESRELAR